MARDNSEPHNFTWIGYQKYTFEWNGKINRSFKGHIMYLEF